MVHVFPKIDVTNASIWLGENGIIHGGSRNRDLMGKDGSIKTDNYDFASYWIKQNEDKLRQFFIGHAVILYGEYLVPHSLKTYRQNVWRKFFIFDVYDTTSHNFLTYDEYMPMLDKYELEYIPCTTKIDHPVLEQLNLLVQSNTYLIEDGKGVGEGIVIKRYDYVNKFGRRTWGKIVRYEFKEINNKEFYIDNKIQQGQKFIELEIARHYITKARIDKLLCKVLKNEMWDKKYIPELFNRMYHEIVTEEIWEIIKKYNNPIIDFKLLKQCNINQIKLEKNELF